MSNGSRRGVGSKVGKISLKGESISLYRWLASDIYRLGGVGVDDVTRIKQVDDETGGCRATRLIFPDLVDTRVESTT